MNGLVDRASPGVVVAVGLGLLVVAVLAEPRAIALAPVLAVVLLASVRPSFAGQRTTLLALAGVALVTLGAIVGGLLGGGNPRHLPQALLVGGVGALGVAALVAVPRIDPGAAARILDRAPLVLVLALLVACATDLWLDATMAGVDAMTERQNMLAVGLVLVTLPVLVVAPARGHGMATLIAGVAMVALLGLTQSQTAQFAVAVAVLAWMADKLLGRRAVWLIGGAFALVLLLAPLVYPWFLASVRDFSIAQAMPLTIRTRLDIWTVAADAIQRAPLLGHGVHGLRGQVAFVASERVAIANHLHSLPLTLWADAGLLGVLGALAVIAAATRAISGLGQRARRAGTVAFAAALAASLVEYVVWFEWVPALWGTIALLVALVARADTRGA